ncbi:hypothetical protein K504DRAFT_337902, partial [Pleomassaria siparia CBS 279.74]
TPPSPTHDICGGGRDDYRPCPDSDHYICVRDPSKPSSCGPEDDCYGICVEEKICGGFAGYTCENEAQVCLDDPRDDCVPGQGGWDCTGLC